MNKILLSQLKKEISTEPNIEINVALRGLGLCDVKIQGLIKKLD